MQSAEIGRTNSLWVFEEVCVCWHGSQKTEEQSASARPRRPAVSGEIAWQRVCVCVCMCVCVRPPSAQKLYSKSPEYVCLCEGGKVERKNMVEPE